jgi:hypothetical protein
MLLISGKPARSGEESVNFVMSFRLSVFLSDRPSIQLSTCINAIPTWRISMKVDFLNFRENLSRKYKFFKSGKKYWAFHMKTYARFIDTGDMKSL